MGSNEAHQVSVDLDESLLSGILQHQQQSQLSANALLSGSPPHSGRTSPPVTPSSTHFFQQPSYQQIALPQQQQSMSQQLLQYQSQQEPLELQVDYWPINKPTIDKDKSQKALDQGKNSIKGTFRSLQVRFTPNIQCDFMYLI